VARRAPSDRGRCTYVALMMFEPRTLSFCSTPGGVRCRCDGSRRTIFSCLKTGRTLSGRSNSRSTFVCANLGCCPPQLSDTTLLLRTLSEKEAQGSHKLLVAVETGTVDEVRSVLAKIQGSERSVLTASSLVADHGQRTPFMAAVRRGDLPIFTALLHYFDRLFSNDVRGTGGRHEWALREKSFFRGDWIGLFPLYCGVMKLAAIVRGAKTQRRVCRLLPSN